MLFRITTSVAHRIALISAVFASFVLIALGCRGPGVVRSQNPATAASSSAADRTGTEIPLTDGALLLNADEARNYVGDSICATCHGAVGRAFAETRHARTLRPVHLNEQRPFFEHANTVKDPVLQYSYQPLVSSGRCVVAGESGSRRGILSADYVIGTGRNARTYFCAERPDSWVDLRVSYYSEVGRWDYTPGQRPGDRLFVRAAGLTQEGPMLPACLNCHVTYLRAGNIGPDIANSHIGIGCERCHGPGRAHVEAVGRKKMSAGPPWLAMEKYAKATPQRINSLCGQCHHDEGNSKDGDAKTEKGLARFEGVALVRSKCFQESRALSCITCHDPHRDVSSDTASNVKRCLTCHSTVADNPARPATAHGKICPVNRTSGCIGCHMPAQKIATIPYAKYHNHLIKVWKR